MSDNPSEDPRIRRARQCLAFAADVVALPDALGLSTAAAAAAIRLADADLAAVLGPRVCGMTDTGELVDAPAAGR